MVDVLAWMLSFLVLTTASAHIMCNNRDMTAAEVLKDGGPDSITHSDFHAQCSV